MNSEAATITIVIPSDVLKDERVAAAAKALVEALNATGGRPC